MTKNLVLLVDDDPVFTQFTQNVLTEKGMKVMIAFNKAEGLELFEKNRPSCIILDIFLPDGSGVDLIKPIRAEGATTPIIMVSGQSEVDEVVRAMRDGANDYIKKPFRGEELLLKIEMVLETTQAKWELEELKTKVRDKEEYKLLFSLSDRMHKVQAMVDQVANTDITVLITGESGTGKELVAKPGLPSSRSTARRCRGSCWRANCSGSRRAHSRERTVASMAGSKWPRTGRSFSTRSARCTSTCSPNSCTSCRRGNSTESEGRRRSGPTAGS